MTRKKKGSKENPVSAEELEMLKKPIDIIKASLNDGMCNYTYEQKTGPTAGDKHNVTGSAIIHDDLRNAFAKLDVHLAVLDEVFKHSDIEIDDILKFENHEHTYRYGVTSFKMKTSGDTQQISLTGTKHISAGYGGMDLTTPMIMLDSLAGYKWYNELLAAADKVREEVELYRGGKCTPQEEPEDKTVVQLTIGSPAAANETADAEFEDAKI